MTRARCVVITVEGSRCRLEGPPDQFGIHLCHKHTKDPHMASRERKKKNDERQRLRKALKALPAHLQEAVTELREDDLCDCCNQWAQRLEELIRETKGDTQ